VKISYCIVSHTKEDIDAIIGNVVTHLRANDVPSFAVFKQRVMAAITKENAEVIDVKQTFDIPDYGNLFKNFAKDSNINGKNMNIFE
jgi:D-lyxose ketol-isomerase